MGRTVKTNLVDEIGFLVTVHPESPKEKERGWYRTLYVEPVKVLDDGRVECFLIMHGRSSFEGEILSAYRCTDFKERKPPKIVLPADTSTTFHDPSD